MQKILFSKKIENILTNLDFSKLGNNVAIKIHFGEKGCETYISPELVKKVYNKIISLDKKATLIECNVLYKGSRTNSTDHIKTAKEHGFNFANIDILDGEDGSEFIELNNCKIGKGIEKYDSIIVLSHFKGHVAAGFGAAFKNLGMGLGSRAGKLHMHANVSPKVNKESCEGCKLCIEKCNANAIEFINEKAFINSEKCEGCAMCIAVCPHKAIQIPFGTRTSEELQRKIAEYSKAIIDKIGKDKIIYINVLENITENCDCLGKKQQPIMEDIGILAGHDIISIELASLQKAGKHFDKINTIDKNKQIEFGIELNLGSKDFEIEEV